MSANCIRCVVNRRTGPDLLCDACRQKPKAFNPNAQTPEELAGNCRFSLERLDDWLRAFKNLDSDPGCLAMAHTSAVLLLDAAGLVVAKLEEKLRQADKPEVVG